MRYGPYVDAFTGGLILTIGRAIYDEITNEFIATIVLDISLDRTTEFLQQDLQTIPTASGAAIRWDDGVVLGAFPWSNRSIDQTHVWQVLEGVEEDLFHRMKADWNESWTKDGVSTNRVYKEPSNKRVAFELSPKPPKLYDPSYVPDLMVVTTIDEDLPETFLNDLTSKVESSVTRLIINTLIAGAIGLLLVIVMLYMVSFFLTHPLQWMRNIADQLLTKYVGAQVSTRFVRVGKKKLADITTDDTDPEQGSSGSASNEHSTAEQVQTAGARRRSMAASSFFRATDRGHGNDENSSSNNNEGNFGDPSSSSEAFDATSFDVLPWSYKYGPKTEIIALVDQFRVLIKRFSGQGTAKLYKREVLEVQNPFFLHPNFDKLYMSRDAQGVDENGNAKSNAKAKQYEYSRVARDKALRAADRGLLKKNTVDSRNKRIRTHWGLNSQNQQLEELNALTNRSTSPPILSDVSSRLPSNASPAASTTTGAGGRDGIVGDNRTTSLRKSALFRWLLLSIAVPLLLTMLCILVYLVWQISAVLPSLIDEVEKAHISLEKDMLGPFARLRAQYVAELASMGARDLHILTRFLSWMHFGAIPLATNTMPSMLAIADECRNSLFGECPALSEAACDCAWNDPRFSRGCTSGKAIDSRYLQKSFLAGLKEDAWPNGDRNFTTYPALATKPELTQFWESIEDLPGTATGPPLSRTGSAYTTFDRVRVMAAASAVTIPLYNYGILSNSDDYPSWGMYMGYAADGMFTGYSGCDHSHSSFAQFQSTPSNRAAEYNPVMCPEGKYG